MECYCRSLLSRGIHGFEPPLVNFFCLALQSCSGATYVEYAVHGSRDDLSTMRRNKNKIVDDFALRLRRTVPDQMHVADCMLVRPCTILPSTRQCRDAAQQATVVSMSCEVNPTTVVLYRNPKPHQTTPIAMASTDDASDSFCGISGR
jgi:hypothetical protein